MPEPPAAQTAEVVDFEPAAAVDEPAGPPDLGTSLVEGELLVEDVSIDGMCGVY